jgi:hypothetical protein
MQVLVHLSKYYQGVFFVPGILEYKDTNDIATRTVEIAQLCAHIPNVILLHQTVIIVDGVAVIGVNGWSNAGSVDTISEMMKTAARYEDTKYLTATLGKLQ